MVAGEKAAGDHVLCKAVPVAGWAELGWAGLGWLGWAGLAAVITPSICPHLSHSLTPTSTNRCRIGRASSDLFVQHDTLHLMIDTHKTHCS